MFIEVSACGNCPFRIFKHDPNKTGYFSYCVHRKIIGRWLTRENDTNLPDWCPLKEEPFVAYFHKK